MDTEGIVPTILPEIPSTKITITYPNEKQVNLGNDLIPNDVKEEPVVHWDCDPDKYYTLLMFDLDAPSRKYPVVSEVNHWLLGNIKGCDVTSADVIAEYRGAGPPKYTGKHRYVFLIFEQNDKITFDEKRIPKSVRMQRLRFSTKDFMKKYNFDKAIAWNYFRSQWDGNVEDSGQETRTCNLA